MNAIEMPQVARARAGVTARERRNLLIGALIFVAAGLVPLVFGGYALQLAISIAMYTALATSWLLFSGPTNYIALSTAAFFGIGMYTVAGGIDLVPYPVLIAAAGLAGAALAAVVGLATLRVSGIYFVIFSLGLAELVRQVMTWLQHVLGTMSGLYVTIDRDEAEYYWQLLSLTAAVFLVGWWIGRSRLGFALRIIGNDEVVAVHCGINTARAKVILFVISSMFAAVAGALVAPRWSYVEPVVAFSPFVSFPGGDHGAPGRHPPPVGTAGRRHSLRAHLGADRHQFSQPDHAAPGGMFPAHRLRHSERHCRTDRACDEPPRQARRIGFRPAAARPRCLGGFSAEPAATAEEPQCLAHRPPRR